MVVDECCEEDKSKRVYTVRKRKKKRTGDVKEFKKMAQQVDQGSRYC